MAYYLGIDTSNYTTSTAVYCSESGEMVSQKKLLPVKNGALGLRQSEAVFSHVRQLGELLQQLMQQIPRSIAAIGVSSQPRRQPDSYMPCFLTGCMAAQAVAAVCRLPVHTFAHQQGHIAAALYGAKRLDLFKQPFIAFHISGGTTECLRVNSRSDTLLDVEILSSSMDLHMGQVVDRVGVMLGLPFPAGPELEKLALQSQQVFTPKAALRASGPCLSGVENQAAAMLQQNKLPCDIARYCLDYLSASLHGMIALAKKRYPNDPMLFSGGVMSNSIIRQSVMERYRDCYFAPPAFSTDNAMGIALLACLQEEGHV